VIITNLLLEIFLAFVSSGSYWRTSTSGSPSPVLWGRYW
jgi:hypothetical protein